MGLYRLDSLQANNTGVTPAPWSTFSPATPAQADTGGVTGWMLALSVSGFHVASPQITGGAKMERASEKSPALVTDGRHYGLAEPDLSGIKQIS